jgi:hypothetical protein
MFLIFALNCFSSSMTSRIHSVDQGKNGEKYLIMFTNGHNAFLQRAERSLVMAVEQSLRNGDTVQINLDNAYNLISIQTVAPARVEPIIEVTPGGMASYNPSIIELTTATQVFQGMRRNYQSQSQCYNRAHIWTYEEFKRSSLRSNKLFLFFTSRYIRKYNYKWWFHVTPMVYVGGSNQSNWMTLDRRYTSRPLRTKTWTNIFMHNDALCPVVYKYSNYRSRQQERDCYLFPASMYYWQPSDLKRLEETGLVKTRYFSEETDHAYWEAF